MKLSNSVRVISILWPNYSVLMPIQMEIYKYVLRTKYLVTRNILFRRGSMDEFDIKLLRDILNKASEKLIKNDAEILENGVNEKTITARLAFYMQLDERLKDWKVDCEYNRDGHIPKYLEGIRRNEGGNVYPDIIIHRRGTKGPNILVIEAKKNKDESEFDIEKIGAYIQEFNYKFGVFLAFEKLENNSFHQEWFAKEKNEIKRIE